MRVARLSQATGKGTKGKYPKHLEIRVGPFARPWHARCSLGWRTSSMLLAGAAVRGVPLGGPYPFRLLGEKLDPWLCLASFLSFNRFLVLSLGTWLEAASLRLFRLTLAL